MKDHNQDYIINGLHGTIHNQWSWLINGLCHERSWPPLTSTGPCHERCVDPPVGRGILPPKVWWSGFGSLHKWGYSPMVYDGLWWFMMVYDWFMMVYDSLWWFMMVYDGFWWVWLVYDWFMIGLCWKHQKQKGWFSATGAPNLWKPSDGEKW